MNATAPAPGGAPSPPAAAGEIVVSAPGPPPRAPFEAGALAMDRAVNPVQPADMSWGDRLQIMGATMQQMARPEGQIAATVSGVRNQSRLVAQEEERKRLAAAQIAGVRQILDQERLRWERTSDSADNPKPEWEQTWVMQMARLAASPEEFMRLYAARTEADENRGIQRAGLANEAAYNKGRLAQGDRELDLRDRTSAQEAEARAKALALEAELGRGRLGVDRADAETRRRAVENDINNAGSGDPLNKALLRADVATLGDIDKNAEGLTQIAGSLRRFGELNERQETGWWRSGTPFLGIAPNADFEQMKAIQSALFPVLGEQLRGALSETDAARVERGTVSVENTTETNQAIVRVGLEAARRAQERAALARQYLRAEGNLDSFNRHWAAYVGQVSAWSDDPKNPPMTFSQWARSKGIQGAGGRP